MLDNNEEISGETINKYICSLHRLSLCTGKLDNLLLYTEQKYYEDSFLIHSLSSILKDITIVNQDGKYERTVFKQDIKHVEAPKNTPEVQIPHEDIKVASEPPQVIQNEHLEDVVGNDKSEYYYEFINSSNLDKIWYSIEAKLLKVMFKNNKRIYHYISVPEEHIKQMIVLDMGNQSAGKYFNETVKKDYEYRETSGDNEMVG